MRKPNSETENPSKLKLYDSAKEVEEEEEEEDYESSSSEGEDKMEWELANVTFEELQNAKSAGSHSVFQKQNDEKQGKRANKNRPTEVGCKKPVSRFREVVQAPKKVVRDPRFESLCGSLDVDGFRKRYNFLFENDLPAEREELCKQLKKFRDPKVTEDLTKRLSWIVNDSPLKDDEFVDIRDHAYIILYLLFYFFRTIGIAVDQFFKFHILQDKQMKFDKSKHTEAAILAEHKKR